jgi:uracil-DNA glycosylase
VFAGPNREPDKEEVFACLPNIDYLIKVIQPEKIILIGDIASSYYKKEFPDATIIMQPSTLEKKGGTNAPSYLHNVRLIQEVIQSLQMKHLRRLYA